MQNKNGTEIGGFLLVKKSSQYFCRQDLQNGVQNFFSNKWVSRYLTFGDFMVPRNCSLQKIISKTRTIENQESSAHREITNHLVKFLQDQIKLWRTRTLRVRSINGIYNSRVTTPSYKTELRIMTSQTELLTLNFLFFIQFFE